jgi:hypothetical protein
LAARPRPSCIGFGGSCSAPVAPPPLPSAAFLLFSSHRHCTTAIGIAQRQNAKFWELRAAISLAWLWREQGKRDAARDFLAPVYGWFTEGFDALDLKEAQAPRRPWRGLR